MQLFKFHQVPTSSTFEEKEKAKKAKEKEDKQKASFSCAGENLVHTSHIFGIFWCRVSLILIDSRDSEMQRTAFAILVQSVGARPVDYKVQ